MAPVSLPDQMGEEESLVVEGRQVRDSAAACHVEALQVQQGCEERQIRHTVAGARVEALQIDQGCERCQIRYSLAVAPVEDLQENLLSPGGWCGGSSVRISLTQQ
jgi:hypothetical protein